MRLRDSFPKNISAIIFDFGGVVLDLSVPRTVEAFRRLGVRDFFGDESESQADANAFFEANESGKFTREEFFRKLRERAPELAAHSEAEIRTAWDAMLGDFVPARIALIRSLRPRYRTFLLSNTNALHRETFSRRFSEQVGGSLDAAFDQTFYSDRLGCVKPSHEIFEKVIAAAKLVPAETLFIDDNERNVAGARECGLNAYRLVPGKEDVSQLFVAD